MRSLSRRGLPSSWAVTLRDSGKVIGTIGFMWYSEANSAAELGYSLSKSFWNLGYATEALRAVIRSVFAVLPVNRLEAQHDLRNPASGRVMEKSGMKKEGILRQRIRNKGEYVDVALFAILRSDLENQPL
jgi:ribosomal-protein-alanine N-acetyltransferase